jgi:hypothetical protein
MRRGANQMPAELTVVIKDDEKRTLTRKHLVYETFSFDEQDPIIAKYIKEIQLEFQGNPADLIVTAKMVVM